MTIYVDAPLWPNHGRMWAHLISDSSTDELRAFAKAQGLPERAFDLDHCDVPAEIIEQLIAAGAIKVTSHELVKILIESGLRIRSKDRESHNI